MLIDTDDEGAPRKKIQLLVVDDDEIIREMLKEAIESFNYQCLVARDAEEAVNILEKNQNIAIAICDIRMPHTNGIELCKSIKEKYNIDIILMTGDLENFSYAKAIEEGATDFVNKPLSIKELHLRLNRIIAHRSLMEERNAVFDKQRSILTNLRQITGGIIKLLSSVIEARDPYTAGHQIRVADLARSIADDMGLDRQRIEGIRMAGAIHDIGKISIPAEILSKPSKLSDYEFALLKSHSQIGYDIVKNIDFKWPIADIIRQHHCRYNGTGYPQPISGDEILLEARIIGVADVVEAISSHRPYRPALGIDKALEEVEQRKGVLYDPDVAASCLNLFASGRYRFK